MDIKQSSNKTREIQKDVPEMQHTTPTSHHKSDDPCIIEMTSDSLRRDTTSHSLDSLARISYPRATPNEYEMFYRTPITSSQTSLNDHLDKEMKSKDNSQTEHRRTEMTDSDGLCTSDSYTASSELSESKYDESSLSYSTHTTSRLAQRHHERKQQYLAEQQQNRLHEQYPQALTSDTNEYAPTSSSCYDPESSPKSSSHYYYQYGNYQETNRGMRSLDSRNASPYESWEDTASKRRSRDGTFSSTRLSQRREQCVEKSSQNENYRHKNRRSTPSPSSGCWSTNTSFSYAHRYPSQSLGSTTTLTSYVDDYQQPRQQRDPNRPHRKHRSRSSSVDDLSSVVRGHKKRSSERQSTSSRLERDRNSRRSHYDRTLSSKRDLNSSKLRSTSGQMQNEPSSNLANHLAIVDDLDFASLYGMNTRKLMGPVLLGLLVFIMLLSLGLAIYFALGRTKDAEFSTANIRLRIINSTLEEDLNYLTKPTFERLSSEYCQQMDRYYLQSTLKKRYRGCEVIALKRQFINFTLYFTEKDISDKQVESVIETSVKFVDNPIGIRTAIVDKFEIEFNDIKVVISQKTEKFDFNKTQLEMTPEIGQTSPPLRYPTQNPKSKFESPPHSKLDKNGNNIGHIEERHPVHQKIPTTSTIKSTIPTRKIKTPRSTITSLEITTRQNIVSKINAKGAIAANVSVDSLKNYGTDRKGENGKVTRVDSVEKTQTHLKVNKKISLTDPCKTRNTGELIPHPIFCEKFYQCVYGTGIIQTCQNGTWFDSKLKVCTLRPKDAVCTPKYEIEKPTSHPSKTTIITTSTTTAILTSSASSSSTSSTTSASLSPIPSSPKAENKANAANTPLLFAENISPVDTVIKLKHLSTNENGKTPGHTIENIGAPLKHVPLKSTTQNSFEDLDVILKEARNDGRYEDNLTLNNKSEGLIQKPCTTSLGDQYHPHPDGCNHFRHCVNGKPEHKRCPDEFVFDFESTSCVRRTPDFVCPDLFPCHRAGTGSYFPHPYHCHMYIQCEFGKEKIMRCASDLVFNPIVKTCVVRLDTNDWKCPEDQKEKKE